MSNPEEQKATPDVAPENPAPSAAPEDNAWLNDDDKFAAAQNEIAALKEQIKDQQLRGLAELENLRKRHVQEMSSAREFAAKDFAFSLLAVKDTLEMVLKDDKSTTEQIKMGVDMTLKNLVGAFERAKVKEVKAEGAKFDPNVHQAMTQIESTDAAPGTVLQVFQKGYTMAERVLRPAMVAVAKAPAAADADTGDGSSTPSVEPGV